MGVSQWRASISSNPEEIERWKREASDLNTERFTHVLLEHGAPLAAKNVGTNVGTDGTFPSSLIAVAKAFYRDPSISPTSLATRRASVSAPCSLLSAFLVKPLEPK